MLAVLFIAILSSLIWVNITMADFINAKINPYYTGTANIDEKKKSEIKTILVVIMALCWAVIFRYNG